MRVISTIKAGITVRLVQAGNVLVLASLLSFSGCTVDPPLVQEPAAIDLTFGLHATTAMNGKITIHEAYLKLDRIDVAGILGEKTNTAITHNFSADEPPFKLRSADSSRVSLNVPSRAYDQFRLQLILSHDDSELTLVANPPPAETPAPGDAPQNPAGEENGDDANTGGHEETGNGNTAGTDNDQPDDSGNETGDTGQQQDQEGDSGKAEEDPSNNGNDSKEGAQESEDDEQGDKPGGKHDDDGGKDKKHKDKKNEDHKDKGKKNKDTDKEDKDNKKDKKGNNKGHDHNDGDDDDHEKDDDDDSGHKGKDHRQDSGDDSRTTGILTADVDLDSFFQNAKPGLVVFATYENNGKELSLIFVASDLEKISVTATQNDAATVRLAAQNSARLSLDPTTWFESLTSADIEGGTVQTYGQQTILFIHPAHNQALYQSIIGHIEESASLNIAP